MAGTAVLTLTIAGTPDDLTGEGFACQPGPASTGPPYNATTLEDAKSVYIPTIQETDGMELLVEGMDIFSGQQGTITLTIGTGTLLNDALTTEDKTKSVLGYIASAVPEMVEVTGERRLMTRVIFQPWEAEGDALEPVPAE